MATYRAAIIADVHGTLPALETVLSDIELNPPDEIFVAGDFVGGPQPHETLTRLRQVGCRFILGNGEQALLKMRQGNAPKAWWTHRQFDLVRWFYQNLNEEDFDFLKSIPEQIILNQANCEPVRIVHGTPWDINKLLFPEKEPEALSRALQEIPESVLVFAHTHLPAMYYKHHKLAINPGSVANNLHGETSISYATLCCEGGAWRPELHFLEYDLSQTVQVFHDTGFLESTRPLARGFLESILTGDNTAFAFVLHAIESARQAGYRDADAVPDEIWLAAENTFEWELEL